MIHIKKIMVPVDFSETSKNAVKYGLSLALEFEATLILAHVVPYDVHEHTDAKLDLFDLIPHQYRECLNFDIVVKAGSVRPEVLGIVDQKNVDLVVMGTRDRPYFERVLLGSLTERMLHKANVPILTVSHLDPQKEIQKPGRFPLRRILHATDLAQSCETGMEFAIRFARGFDAKLMVAHVVRTGDAPSAEVRTHAEERLGRLVGPQSKGGLTSRPLFPAAFPTRKSAVWQISTMQT